MKAWGWKYNYLNRFAPIFCSSRRLWKPKSQSNPIKIFQENQEASYSSQRLSFENMKTARSNRRVEQVMERGLHLTSTRIQKSRYYYVDHAVRNRSILSASNSDNFRFLIIPLQLQHPLASLLASRSSLLRGKVRRGSLLPLLQLQHQVYSIRGHGKY